ncbi:MAG: T9SS type A sorting domain-containing protein [Cryomorphaceae bacterium]
MVETTPFPGVQFSSIAFSDVDGDGDEDVLITGTSSLGSIANLYTNEGGSFALVEGTPFEAVIQSSIAFSDIDSDGDEDVLITGQNSSSQRVANLYTNDGGVFTLVENTPFAGVYEGSVAFADMDGDGDDDLLITGDTAIYGAVSNVYENDGGSFTLVENTSIEEAFGGSVAFSDIDGDGDLDLIVTGQSLSEAAISKLYRNITMPNGIAEAERKTFSIAPNPTSGMAAIDLSQIGTGRIDLSVFDINGKQVQQESLLNATSTLTVDFSELEIGVYLVSIQNRYAEKFTSKLVTIE